MNKELLDLLHRRIAGTSVGASTARGMSPRGTIAAARNYLAGLDLSRFSVQSEKEFRGLLNRATRAYVKKLPVGAQCWGPARKFLNIFLRGVVYNKYLCAAYELGQIEPWLEVPLDSHVAKGLKGEDGGNKLPRWQTVVGLDADTRRRYQLFASQVAAKRGVCRIHLDLLYWRRQGEAANKRRTRKPHP
jgi:hypothetical protein